jgi:3-hydroxybutyryl-CoA dehydratase
MMSGNPSFNVGDELVGPVRAITAQRIEWYDSAMLSAATNELRQVGSNIHTDEEFARSEGFAAANADGMIMTNWCSEMLVRAFGMDYLERGELRTKYIKPVYLGVPLHVRGRIKEATRQPNGSTMYAIDVWCEDEQGTKLVDGDAKVDVARD